MTAAFFESVPGRGTKDPSTLSTWLVPRSFGVGITPLTNPADLTGQSDMPVPRRLCAARVQGCGISSSYIKALMAGKTGRRKDDIRLLSA